MTPPLDSYDIEEIQTQKEFASSRYSFTFWRQQWETFEEHIVYEWRSTKLEDSQASNIPLSSGVYTLILKPAIANHPECAYLMYVGKAKSLRRRFREYLTSELRRTPKRRPKIFRTLVIYPDKIHFCFAPISESEIGAAETSLIRAFMPPLNDQLPAEVSKIVRAFS